MSNSTSAPKQQLPQPQRPRTTIELIDAIVTCDSKTRRTTSIISSLTTSVVIVLLTIAFAGVTIGVRDIVSALMISFGSGGLLLATSTLKSHKATRSTRGNRSG